MRRTLAAAIALAGIATWVWAQDSLKFEVASLKPSQPGARGPFGIRPAPGGQRYVANGAMVIDHAEKPRANE
jgi:hypothetical protein